MTLVGTNAVLAVKPYSPRMYTNNNNVYASAKHSAVRGMCADPDMLVFSWHKFSLYYI